MTTDTIVWIDVETTGLDPARDSLLEVACLVTDTELNLLDEVGFQRQISHNQNTVDFIKKYVASEYVWDMHQESGLWRRVLNGDSLPAVDYELSEYIKDLASPGSPLAGNSITLDRNFLSKNLPTAFSQVGYRSVDVTSIALLAQAWYGEDVAFQKQKNHRALADIRESIEELRHYRNTVFLNHGKAVI